MKVILLLLAFVRGACPNRQSFLAEGSDRKLKNNCIRSQCPLNRIKTEQKTQKNGVPQGEILSVPLFLVAINSVVSHIPKNIKKLFFADDLVILFRDKHIKNIKREL